MGRQGRALPAALAEAPSGSNQLKIATVELGKIQREYAELQSREKDLTAWADEHGGYLQGLASFLFLSAENFQEVAPLLRKPQPTEAEKKRLEELRKVSQEKEKRYVELLAKTERTPQEEDDFNSLWETQEARKAARDELEKQFRAEFLGKQSEAVRTLMAKVRQAINAEASAQNFDYVFDADIVLFGGTDITDEVLNRLNAGQEEVGEEEEGGGDQGGR